MSSLQELLAQKAEIDRQISDARRQERNEAISRVRALMAEHGLTASDLVAKTAGPRASKPRENRCPVVELMTVYAPDSVAPDTTRRTARCAPVGTFGTRAQPLQPLR